MPEKWTGDLVGRMHNEDVTLEDLANQMGVTKGYISQILHSKRTPTNAEERLNTAFADILTKRKTN